MLKLVDIKHAIFYPVSHYTAEFTAYTDMLHMPMPGFHGLVGSTMSGFDEMCAIVVVEVVWAGLGLRPPVRGARCPSRAEPGRRARYLVPPHTKAE